MTSEAEFLFDVDDSPVIRSARSICRRAGGKTASASARRRRRRANGREEQMMNPNTRKLHDLGQSLWLDNISREILTNGTLARYIADLSLTGLTSNPTIFEHAIGDGNFYDESIADLARQGKSGEDLFFALALQDLTQAADLFRPVFEATGGVDGWVSLEVSPLLADDTAKTIEAAARQHAAAARPNLFIKIPGTPAGVPAIEESIFAGVPINVTLLFSREHYLAAAEAYMRGIERRIAAGPRPEGRIGGLALRQPLGRRGEGRAPAAVPESPRHRHRDAHLQGVPRPARLGALAKARAGRRPSAAAALGQHRHQGPGRARHALRRSARGARHDQHDAGKDAAGVRRPWQGRRSHAGRRRQRRGRDRGNRGAKASTTMRWPQGCSTKAPMPSRSRGRRCCRASEKRARNSSGSASK